MEPSQALDRFGFVKKAPLAALNEAPETKLKRIRKENERTEKWRKMIASSQNLSRIYRSRDFERRVYKGIPDALRGFVWSHMLTSISDEKRSRAHRILETADSKLEESESGQTAKEAIGKDLNRTYPFHTQFQSLEGQKSLETVLAAYAVVDDEVGYCQGMSFVTAMFLMYMNEDDAFCLLETVMGQKPWMMREMFKPDMAAIAVRLYQYEQILKVAARKVQKHFADLGFEPSMYATHWMATIFAYNFPFFLVVRIWDIFLLQGWSIVIGASVAFWRIHEKLICGVSTFEALFDNLKQLVSTFPLSKADDFIRDACYVSSYYASERTLKSLEKEYYRSRVRRS